VFYFGIRHHGLNMGKSLIWIGIALAMLGVILTWAPGLLKWFGRLPGDIRIEGEHGVIFIPITSMLLLSIVLTVILNLFLRK
jgi:hypothetical protein